MRGRRRSGTSGPQIKAAALYTYEIEIAIADGGGPRCAVLLTDGEKGGGGYRRAGEPECLNEPLLFLDFSSASRAESDQAISDPSARASGL